MSQLTTEEIRVKYLNLFVWKTWQVFSKRNVCLLLTTSSSKTSYYPFGVAGSLYMQRIVHWQIIY